MTTASLALDEDAAARALIDLGTQFAALFVSFLQNPHAGAAECAAWADRAAAGEPERKWAALDAAAAFARGMRQDAGVDPQRCHALAQQAAAATRELHAHARAGLRDATAMTSLPIPPEDDLPRHWLAYATNACPPDRYRACILGFLALSAALAPAAARRLQG